MQNNQGGMHQFNKQRKLKNEFRLLEAHTDPFSNVSIGLQNDSTDDLETVNYINYYSMNPEF